MIQRRGDDWAADPSIRTSDAKDLQALLQAIVSRYRLMGAVLASSDGEVRAQVGPALADASDGFQAALAGDSGSLKSLADAIEGKTLPRYFSQGDLDAYADVPAPGLVVLFMRERAIKGSPPTELQMVSDYNIAKEMAAELRQGMVRIGQG